MNKLKLEEQELLFSIFHDGSIYEIIVASDQLVFQVDIMYLAERISPNFRCFYIHIKRPLEFYFEESDSLKKIFDLEEINKLELEILKTEINKGVIKVFCSANNGNIFGFLHIKAVEIEIYDQLHKSIELERLRTIAQEYWDDFGKRWGL